MRTFGSHSKRYRERSPVGPSPELLVRLVGVTYRLDGSAKALKLLADGAWRWPAADSIRLLSAAIAIPADRLDETRRLVLDTLQADPTNVNALAAKARLALFLDEPEEAIDPARGVIPEHPSLGRALLAVALHQTGRITEDPGLIDGVLADTPADPWLLVELAQAMRTLRRPMEELRLLDMAAELAPNDREISRQRGIANLMLGRYAEAADDLAHAAEDGWDPLLTALRGEAARMQGDAATAVELFGSIRPEDKPDWVASSTGSAYLTLGDPRRARAAFEKALAQNPRDIGALCGLSEIELDDGDPTSIPHTEEMLRRAVDIPPLNARAIALLAELFRRTVRLDQALRAFDQALTINPKDSYALGRKGLTLIDSGQRRDGLELMVEALELAPEATWILDEIFHHLTVDTVEGYEEADALARSAQRLIRDSAETKARVLTQRARLAKTYQRSADAAKLYRRALQLAPDDLCLTLESAETLQQVGRKEEALALLDPLRAANPQDQDVAMKRIEILWELSRLSEARDDLELLLADPDHRPAATAALGEIYRLEGRRTEARRLLESAIKQHPDDAFTLASLGALDLDDGDLAAGRTRLMHAGELRPGYGFALNILIRLEIEAGRLDRVTELLERMEPPDPADRELAHARAVALYGLGDYEAALEVLGECLTAGGVDPTLLRTRGWVEIGLARPRLAKASFRAAAELPDTAASIVDSVITLVRVDLWSEAFTMATQAFEEGNPFAATALAVVWLRAGDWEKAKHTAIQGLDRTPANRDSALYAIRALRYAGESGDSLNSARTAIGRWPTDWAIQFELAESLWAAGQQLEAQGVFRSQLNRIRRQTFRDADQFTDEGRCLLHLGEPNQAVQVLLRALSATDQTAKVLFDLVLASLLDGDATQARALEDRAVAELGLLSSATQRGLIGAALQDLERAMPNLDARSRAGADRAVATLARRHDNLSGDVDGLMRSTQPVDA